MKKIFTIVVVIAILFATSAYAEIQPYGGYNEIWFYEFIDEAVFTEVVTCNNRAYQEVWFANDWHIIIECDEKYVLDDYPESVIIHVYDSKGWIVDSWTILHNDDGEQFFWDLLYNIANEEL